MFRHSRKKLWENISKILSKVGISVQGIGRDSGSCICYLILIKFLQRSELDWQLLHGRKRQSSTHWDFAVQCEHWLPSWFPHRYKHCPDLSDIVRLPKPWPLTSEALEWQDTQRTENWKDPVVQLQVKWSELFGQMDHGFFLPKFSADPNGERGHFQLCVCRGTPLLSRALLSNNSPVSLWSLEMGSSYRTVWKEYRASMASWLPHMEDCSGERILGPRDTFLRSSLERSGPMWPSNERLWAHSTLPNQLQHCHRNIDPAVTLDICQCQYLAHLQLLWEGTSQGEETARGHVLYGLLGLGQNVDGGRGTWDIST